MKARKNICVRLERDAEQIRRCKKQVEAFGEAVANFADTLKLTSNAVRLQMLLLFEAEGRLCVCDLAEILEMTVSAVSQHLKKLHQGGLVAREQEGVTIYYFLKPEARPLLRALFEWLPSKPKQAVLP